MRKVILIARVKGQKNKVLSKKWQKELLSLEVLLLLLQALLLLPASHQLV
jgi:hypothetical protein